MLGLQEGCTVDNVRNRNKLHIKGISRLFPGCLVSVSWVFQLTRVFHGYLLYVSGLFIYVKWHSCYVGACFQDGPGRGVCYLKFWLAGVRTGAELDNKSFYKGLLLTVLG